jgi:hypothetical protein
VAHQTIAENAFDAWLRVLRWKSNNGHIGRPILVGPESGWGTYLIEENTGHRFWAATRTLHGPPGQALTLVEWSDAAHALSSGVFSPVHYDLLFDAIEHFQIEDFQRSIVDSAVACESYMRAKVMQTVPLGLGDSIRKYIDEANIRQVLNRFFPEILTEEKRAKLKGINSMLHQLFDARNTILHSGHKADLTLSECQRYLEATQTLIALD